MKAAAATMYCNIFLQQDVIIEGFNEILPSLNDIFIHLLKVLKQQAISTSSLTNLKSKLIMNKILLVARREFLSRVQKKTFLLSTILLPVIIFGFYAMMIYFSVKSDSSLKIAVADRANLFGGNIDEKESDLKFVFVNNETDESLKKKSHRKKYDAYVSVPARNTIS